MLVSRYSQRLQLNFDFLGAVNGLRFTQAHLGPPHCIMHVISCAITLPQGPGKWVSTMRRPAKQTSIIDIDARHLLQKSKAKLPPKNL